MVMIPFYVRQKADYLTKCMYCPAAELYRKFRSKCTLSCRQPLAEPEIFMLFIPINIFSSMLNKTTSPFDESKEGGSGWSLSQTYHAFKYHFSSHLVALGFVENNEGFSTFVFHEDHLKNDPNISR